jgi:hypothetical protein
LLLEGAMCLTWFIPDWSTRERRLAVIWGMWILPPNPERINSTEFLAFPIVPSWSARTTFGQFMMVLLCLRYAELGN